MFNSVLSSTLATARRTRSSAPSIEKKVSTSNPFRNPLLLFAGDTVRLVGTRFGHFHEVNKVLLICGVAKIEACERTNLEILLLA